MGRATKLEMKSEVKGVFTLDTKMEEIYTSRRCIFDRREVVGSI